MKVKHLIEVLSTRFDPEEEVCLSFPDYGIGSIQSILHTPVHFNIGDDPDLGPHCICDRDQYGDNDCASCDENEPVQAVILTC